MIALLRRCEITQHRLFEMTSRSGTNANHFYRHFPANERCYWPATYVSGVRERDHPHRGTRDSNHVRTVCRIEGDQKLIYYDNTLTFLFFFFLFINNHHKYILHLG